VVPVSLFANGVPVSRARVTMPRQGCWTADIVVPDPDAITGKVTLAMDNGLTLVGTAERGGVWLDSNYIRIAPGANGLKKQSKPKPYRNVSLGTIAKDLLGNAGETLAASSNSGLLAVQFPWYTQSQDAIGRCLSALILDRRLASPVWRALPDGTIWLGYETWPDAGIKAPGDYQDISEAPQEGRAELGVETWTLTPGMSLEGRHLSDVEHYADGENVRSTVWFE
jgi:hypothetical protein